MTYWDQQNAIFAADDEWQRRQRDLILMPSYKALLRDGSGHASSPLGCALDLVAAEEPHMNRK